MDKARRSPASLITRSTGREDARSPVLHADEPPRFPPDATILRVEGMGMAHFGGNALGTVSTHRAERGISFGSELRSLLRHRAPPRLGAVQPVRFELDLDLYVGSLDAHGVSRNAAWGRRPEHGAGLDVVDGPMPRARDLPARHLTLRERAATVGAGVVNGVEAALQVEEGELLPRHLDTLGLARSEVAGARDLGELRHGNLLALRRW